MTFRGLVGSLLGAACFVLLLVMLAPLQATRATFLYDLAPHVVVGAVGVALIGALMRHRILLTLALALVIAAGWPVAVAQLREPAALPSGTDGTTVRLLWASLRYDFLDQDAFARLRTETAADVTVVTELPKPPFTLGPQATGTGGRTALDVMIESKWPVAGLTVRHRGGGGLPVIAVDYTLPDSGGTLRVVGVHAPHPIGGWPVSHREQALDAAIALVNDAPERGKVILTGDFNLTPWAPSFARVLAETGLRTTTPRGLPIFTWPDWLLWGGLPIDHILVGSAIGVRHFERGPAIGSDHRPLIAELEVSKLVQLRLGSRFSGSSNTPNPAAVAMR